MILWSNGSQFSLLFICRFTAFWFRGDWIDSHSFGRARVGMSKPKITAENLKTQMYTLFGSLAFLYGIKIQFGEILAEVQVTLSN